MSDLRVGQHVKVVAPDSSSGCSDWVGKCGYIVCKHVFFEEYDWDVAIDGDDDNPWAFSSQELAPLDVTAFEGVVDDTRMGEDYPGVWIDVAKVDDELAKFAGKRVRVTVEVLDS